MAENNNALIEKMSIKILSAIVSVIQERRVMTKEHGNNDIEVVNVKLEVESDMIFKIFERIVPYVPKEYFDFFINFFLVLDSVKNIDKISSVTPRNKYSNSSGIKNIKETSYDIAAKTTLLEHIANIVEMITVNYERTLSNELDEKERLSKNEFLHLIFLALFHDIGKIIPLMDKYGVGLDMGHEKRSLVFLKMFIETYKKDENLKKNMDSLEKNMQRLADYKTNTLLNKFHRYDENARLSEIKKLKTKEK